MLVRSPLRWYTFRIMVLTSIVWVIFGMCILVYYMECLAGNGINCHRQKAYVQSNFLASADQLDQSNENLNLKYNYHNNDNDSPTLHLPPYSSSQLQTWSPAVIKSNPTNWPGENGKGVEIPKEQEEEKKEKFVINQFNILASDKIALNRTLKDVRLQACRRKRFPKHLPTTSIVIVFHNEAWSTLLRTVFSIIRTSPKNLLKEIILVDDASEREYLGKKLEDYVATLPVPVKVLRTGKRSGLIRARLIGADQVKGEVITFLDAHCECTKGWLEPLLTRLAEDRTRVVCPIIDVISDDNFEYITASDKTWGGFNWKLNFRWYHVPTREFDRRNNDRTLPVRTPTMAGGLFSIDREYFNKLGRYDEGMDIWGGENLEMSFRVWMCGGTLEIVTCSHVGHVFRKSTPYTFPGGTSNIVNHNNARLAEVWMDEWKDFFFAINPAAKNINMGDTTKRKQLRKDLKCRDFRWYLENIYPESQMPLNYYSLGEIRNIKTQKCLDTFGRKSGESIGLSSCHGMGGNQVFAYTKTDQIMSDDNCMDASSLSSPVKLIRCHGMGGNQAWVYNNSTKQIIHKKSGHCLDSDSKVEDKPKLKKCNIHKTTQRWKLINNFKWQSNGTQSQPEEEQSKNDTKNHEKTSRKKNLSKINSNEI